MDAVSSEPVAPATPSMPSTWKRKDSIGARRVRSVLAERDAVRIGQHGLARARIAGELDHIDRRVPMVPAGRAGARRPWRRN